MTQQWTLLVNTVTGTAFYFKLKTLLYPSPPTFHCSSHIDTGLGEWEGGKCLENGILSCKTIVQTGRDGES